ncbi:hypothetical protein KIN20_014213, partial [Parelaphostrongylus tenuis]
RSETVITYEICLNDERPWNGSYAVSHVFLSGAARRHYFPRKKHKYEVKRCELLSPEGFTSDTVVSQGLGTTDSSPDASQIVL